MAVFSCTVGTTDGSVPLGAEIWIDDHCIYNREHVAAAEQVRYEFADTAGEHTLEFRLKNKQPEHTQLNADGQIVKDCAITVRDVCFADVPLGHTLVERAIYRHNYNGTAPDTQAKFYGEMGCNGQVQLKFTTPIYLWLLEHTQ